MSKTVDLYQIMGVKRDATTQDVKKAFNKLALKHHPDRGGDEELFEIINNAYTILINPDSRKQYDILYESSVDNSNLHGDLKTQNKQFMDTQSVVKTDDDDNKFKELWLDLNKKHNYYEESKDEIKISSEQASGKFQSLMTNRKQNDEEDKPELLFDHTQAFTIERFNAVFDKMKKESNELMVKDTPDAWAGQGSLTMYSSLDTMHELYNDESNLDDVHGINYGTINFHKQFSGKRMTKDDVKDINPEDADYVKNHNKIEDDYIDKMKQKLKDRESSTSTFDGRKMEDYDAYKNETAGYGIFEKVGITFDKYVTLKDLDSKDTNDKFQKLLADRSKI